MLNTQTNGFEPQHKPLYVQVRDHLASMIGPQDHKRWPPGRMLPNEADLAKELRVAAGTVRKALDLLEKEHIVSRRQGRGTTVLNKKLVDQQRNMACLERADKVINVAVEAAGSGISPKVQAALRISIGRALFDAGYSVELEDA